MKYQSVFLRRELKYVLSREQKFKILSRIADFSKPDEYGRVSVRSLYYDTDDYRLIRRSIEKPAYKEKLRIRAYNETSDDGAVFVELKKKYDGLVYKRRILLTAREATEWLSGKAPCPKSGQIPSEIDYFMSYYGQPEPRVFLSYEREAYSDLDGDVRITFDENIRAGLCDLKITSAPYGERILEDELTLMEIKCTRGMPLWLARRLSEEWIYKTSFSKYGTAYQRLIYPSIKYHNSMKKEMLLYG